jgi:hypothetical protein
MGKKTGKKATYETYGGTEIKEIIQGKEIGLSFNQATKTYYTMIPKEFAGVGAKRSKQIWLKSDLDNAVIKFRAMVAEIKGEKETTVSVEKYDAKERHEIVVATTMTLTSHPKDIKFRQMAGIELKDGETKEVTFHKKVPYLDIPEHYYIKWLKDCPISKSKNLFRRY